MTYLALQAFGILCALQDSCANIKGLFLSHCLPVRGLSANEHPPPHPPQSHPPQSHPYESTDSLLPLVMTHSDCQCLTWKPLSIHSALIFEHLDAL